MALIKELREAGPEEFAKTIKQIGRNLQKQAVNLTRTRRSIAGLTAGDRLIGRRALQEVYRSRPQP